MLKQFGISFCFLLSFALLQAHNFIPHHHEKVEIDISHHGHSHSHNNNGNHHDHEDDDKNDHKSPLTDLSHNVEFGKVITKAHFIKKNIEKPVLYVPAFILLNKQSQTFDISPRPHPPDESPLHIIFLSHSVPLRAPPAPFCMS